MRFFNFFAVVCLLFFFAGCGEGGVTRVVPEADTDDPADPTDDPTDDIDDPTDPTDDTDDPTDDHANPTDDTDDPTDDTDDPTDDIDDPTDDEDPTEPENDSDDPLTDEEKCAAAGGTWDDFAEEDFERCYKIVNCIIPEDENAEYMVWLNGESYTLYFDFANDTWTGETYGTEYNDSGDPEICHYICASNATREDGKCKPYCSAVFDGSSSKIEVAHNDMLNLEHFWTIEAWVKQDLDDLSTNALPIVRKGGKLDSSYYLTALHEEKKGLSLSDKYKKLYGGFYYEGNIVDQEFTAETDSGDAEDLEDALNPGWNHIALSFYIKLQESKAYLRLYVNGKLVAVKSTQSTDLAPKTVSDALTIGYSAKKVYFKGRIDQLKITRNYYEDEFTPSQLSVDSNTIAFWDFSNTADDSSENGLNGIGTNVTYSTDCAF